MRYNLKTNIYETKFYTKFYFAIIMALMLVSCSKDSEVLSTDNSILSLETAKSYFEKCFISESLTKSSEEFKISNRLFYTGDFTPQWDKTKYSKNSVLEGYDVEIFLPKYKYVVEREIYEKGSIKTFSVDVTQKLVVMREPETGRMSQYILTLIPDKQCSDIHKHKVKENFFSFSDKNGFSGIAIHTIPQLGIPVSIAQYFNGVIVRSVMMVADSEEGMIDNAKKAFEILGPMKIKSKNRLMTRSSGCDSNGSYGDGDEWKISGYERLSNGLFWDGTNYWYDSDGDGIPDSIILDEVVVEGEYTGGGGGNELVNPGSGYGGGENEGGGSSGSSGSNDSSEISDSDAYALGLSVFIDMDKEIKNGNITTRGLNLSTLAHYSTPLSYASNVQGLWASWLETVDTSVLTQKFGKGLAKAGFVLGMPQAISTIAVLIEGNTENLTMSDIMGLVSTALSGFVAFGVITGTAGAIVGFSAAVIGVASIFVNENNQYLPSQIELDNGITITILYA